MSQSSKNISNFHNNQSTKKNSNQFALFHQFCITLIFVYTGPVVEVDEADDSISDDEEPREEQVPSLATAVEKPAPSPQQTAETEKEKSDLQKEKSDVQKEKSDLQKEKSDVQKEKSDLQKEKSDVQKEKSDLQKEKSDVQKEKSDLQKEKSDIQKEGGKVIYKWSETRRKTKLIKSFYLTFSHI